MGAARVRTLELELRLQGLEANMRAQLRRFAQLRSIHLCDGCGARTRAGAGVPPAGAGGAYTRACANLHARPYLALAETPSPSTMHIMNDNQWCDKERISALRPGTSGVLRAVPTDCVCQGSVGMHVSHALCVRTPVRVPAGCRGEGLGGASPRQEPGAITQASHGRSATALVSGQRFACFGNAWRLRWTHMLCLHGPSS